MATREELLRAMKVIKNHCKTIEYSEERPFTSCHEICPLSEECSLYLEHDVLPEDWDLEDGETND